MKNLLFVRIPSLCICFTLITLTDVLLGIIRGDRTSLYIPILFLWLILCQAIDFFVSKIDFHKWLHYCIAESLILYFVSLAFWRIFFWSSLTGGQLLYFTVIFLITDIFVFSYFRKRQKIQADEINALLSERQ